MYAVMFRNKDDNRWSYIFTDVDAFNPENISIINAQEFDLHQLDLSDVGVFSQDQASKLFTSAILAYREVLSEIKVSRVNPYQPHNEVDVFQYREFK